jgi:hypothetical protein
MVAIAAPQTGQFRRMIDLGFGDAIGVDAGTARSRATGVRSGSIR